MQVSSISSTSFGLKVDPSMKAILDKSEKVVAKQGKKELDLWRRNVKVLDKTAPDDYTLYVEHINNEGFLKFYNVRLQIDNIDTDIYHIGEKGILDRNDIKDIKKRIINERKSLENIL